MFLAQIAITEIFPPVHAVRAAMDEVGLRELKESIQRVGIRVPLIVKKVAQGYEVIAGHRRYVAAQEALVPYLPCLIREETDPPEEAIKLHENLYREDLSPVEEAAFYAELLEKCGGDTDALATLVHQSRNYVEKRLLLMKGYHEVLTAVAQKEITLGVAEELNEFKTHKTMLYYLEWAKRVGAKRSVVKDWRRSAEYNEQFGGAPSEAGLAPATPGSLEVEPPRCFICKSAEDAYDFSFQYIHRSCMRMVERNAPVADAAPRPNPAPPE